MNMYLKQLQLIWIVVLLSLVVCEIMSSEQNQQQQQHQTRHRRCSPNNPMCYRRPVTRRTTPAPTTLHHNNPDGWNRPDNDQPEVTTNYTTSNETTGNQNFHIQHTCNNSMPHPQHQPSNVSAPLSNQTKWTHYGKCSSDLLRTNGGTAIALNYKSMCPWSYEAHFDANREPQTLMYAKCECPHCIINGNFSTTQGYRCTPVFMQLRVWRTDLYRDDYEEVPIACVCSRPTDL